MKSKSLFFGLFSIALLSISTIFVCCNKDLNDVVYYSGQVVYIKTTTPFPNLAVKITDGTNIHCQDFTDEEGMFRLKVKVTEINGSYFLLAGDSTCIPKKMALGGYGQKEVDLGVIEVEGPTIPVVVTHPMTSVTAEEAICGGEVTSTGRLKVTARGVCYGKEAYPEVSGLHTKDGEGLGEFTSNLKDLDHNTIYYARAYATNSMGTAYGEQIKFTTEEGVPIVTTDSVYRITAHTARCKGHVESDGGFKVTKRGTCWSTHPDPTIDDDFTDDGSGIGEFTSSLKDLKENTQYYIRTYATNSTATVYGEDTIITTLDGLAKVTLDSIPKATITASGFTAHGTVVSDCDITVTARGFCYSTTQYPTIDDEHTTSGKDLGAFKSVVNALKNATTYYIRAYATNNTATVYSDEQITITTLDGLPIVSTDSIRSVTASGFTAHGTVVSDCGIPITARGFCYSTDQYPTIENDHIASGKDVGSFKSVISKLEYSTTYYVRAYATNATETTYGEQFTVTTLNGLPKVTTAEVTNIGSVRATCGGEVTDDGTLSVTARGVCYSTEPQPTIDDKHTTDGKGIGSFTSSLKDLQDKTTYYVRAYATTDAGTSYGSQKSFKTENGVPVVVLSKIGEPTANSVACEGKVTGDGGVTLTERGFCYSTSQYPSNTDSHIALGTGVGDFSGSLTGLTINTTYYVRAYAVNSLGVGYSEQKSFTTKDGLATVTTGEATSTATAINTGGEVTDNGGYAVSERGICYSSVNSEPTTTDNKVAVGSGNGKFNTSVSGLSAATTYYIRAYAINANGTSYGKAVTIVTKNGQAAVSAGEITGITAKTASSSVTVTDAAGATLQSCGICWSTSPNPLISDNKAEGGNQTGTAYTCNLTGLTPATTYYVKAYAITDIATSYSEAVTFKTTTGLPVVTTSQPTATATTISTGGEVTSNGGYAVIERGICYSSTNSEPTILDNKLTSGSGNGTFKATITDLAVNTTYYVRAYATNENGTAYGTIASVTTLNGSATVTIGEASDITAKTASCAVTVTDAGGATLQSCGICWSTAPNPIENDNKKVGGSQVNTTYSCGLTELSPNTVYYVRAFATTDIATAYSSQISFQTTTGLPIVSTGEITATSTTITAEGAVTSDGGYSITARGVCYSTSNSAPTLDDSYTTAGIGTGSFSTVITDVSINTTYYVCTYATNSIGTAYGNVSAVTTGNGLPIVTTMAVTLNDGTLVSGGNVTDDGGSQVTARGVCYGSFPHPDLSDAYSHTSDGTGIGYYASILESASGDIYVRAYATNANGTGYGNEYTVNASYLQLPTFIFNGATYKVAPDPGYLMMWEDANTYCEGLYLYGYSDWRLPTKDELYQMYIYQSSIGGFNTDFYWSSTHDGSLYCYMVAFGNGTVTSYYKSQQHRVRPIRKENEGK